MNILVSDNWLRAYLKTNARPQEIVKYLSLCGPSIEKVEKLASDHVYSIEVTTNRADSASIYGIAREAAAILPNNGINASVLSIKVGNLKFMPKVKYLEAKVDSSLCMRFTSVLIKNVHIAESPQWMKERLTAVGVRPINNVVDISNYVMHELGQPVHTFDYDKIKGSKMILRASKKGEKLTTLDGKVHNLPGGDIIIEDATGRLIDLAGIMGGQNSAVDEKTTNVLLFVQTYNPFNIRKTSMSLAQRTEAAELFEKGLDPELVTLGISRGIELFRKLTKGVAEKEILDIYPSPYQPKTISTRLDTINSLLGTSLEKHTISKILSSLGFKTAWNKELLDTLIPSWRSQDILIPEDLVEEVARIYGYHKLPSTLMSGLIPEPPRDTPFKLEGKIKQILKGYGGVEVYTLSLVSHDEARTGLKLKNPLGEDGEYLRTSLMTSLLRAAKENSGEKEPFHLFEMANVYLPKKGELPTEKMMLAGIFRETPYREAKGVVEGLLTELNIPFELFSEEAGHFVPNRHIYIKSHGKILGEFGELSEDYFYYEFSVESLREAAKDVGSFKGIPKFPPQIEDITFTFPERTRIGKVVDFALAKEKLVKNIELTDTYKDAYTFRLWYQHPEKTLTDSEVGIAREKILKGIKEKFGGIVKS